MTLPSSPPDFVKRTSVEFAYPFVSPTFIILTPTPTWGNNERLSGTRVQTETRGGDLIVFGDPTWPKDDELAWTLTNLCLDEKQRLASFIKVSLGKEFRLTDHESNVWRAIITNPNTEFVEDYRHRFTVNLTMNVVLTSWP